MPADERVRVLPRRQGGEAQRAAGLEQRQGALGGATRGALAGRVAIEADNRLGGEPPDELQLALGQRGAERRHRPAQPGLVERDDVHVALGDDDVAAVADPGARAVERVEVPPLVEERRVARVEVLGLPVAQDPAAEGDDAPSPVRDREHRPAAEEVEAVAPVVRLRKQRGLQQHRLLEALLAEGLLELLAPVRRVAQAEGADGLVAEAAAAEVFQRRPPAGGPELLLEPFRRRLDGVAERLAPLLARRVLRRRAWYLEPGLLGEALDGLGEAEVVDAHREADDVAMRAAAEAVEEALVVVDEEARALLVVEGAEAGELASLLDQAHAPSHHARAGEAVADLVQELRREGHGAGRGGRCEGSGAGRR